MRKETVIVNVKLDQEEINARAKEAGKLREEINNKEKELKNKADTLKGEIKKLTSSLDRILNVINLGYEDRGLSCEVKINHKKNCREYYFDGELVKTGPLNEFDRQQSLIPEKDDEENVPMEITTTIDGKKQTVKTSSKELEKAANRIKNQ